MMDSKQIVNAFTTEFKSMADKFVRYDLGMTEARDSKEEHIWKPGVYVFWHPADGVVKVGRHLSNARKRALEHLRDNTGGKMSQLANDPDARLLLFNVKDDKDKHWVAALEIYFEEHLKPEIKSERLG